MSLFGAIEAGGTKFVCTVGDGPEGLRALTRFDTTTPAETLARVIDFLRRETHGVSLASVGIACFGPLDLDPNSASLGSITTTPKPGWAWTDIAGTVREALRVPVVLDTDVNGAALAEYRWGAAQGLETFVYQTVGTGIGGGAMVNGALLHGLVHPEMGHLRIPHDLAVDPFPGCCPSHGDCLEGLASGTALARRWGRPAEVLPPEHPAWELEARYLALGIANIVCTLSPHRILLGGGVMKQKRLLPLIRRGVQDLLAGYLVAPGVNDQIDAYIVPPALGDRAGVLGALALAQTIHAA